MYTVQKMNSHRFEFVAPGKQVYVGGKFAVVDATGVIVKAKNGDLELYKIKSNAAAIAQWYNKNPQGID